MGNTPDKFRKMYNFKVLKGKNVLKFHQGKTGIKLKKKFSNPICRFSYSLQKNSGVFLDFSGEHDLYLV